MGCDIHLYVERLDDNDLWKLIPTTAERYYRDWNPEGDPEWQKTIEKWWENDYRSREINSSFSQRNYRLFDALAGVRCPLGRVVVHNNKYIYVEDKDESHVHDLTTPLFDAADPDQPEDGYYWHSVSPEVQKQIESYDIDGHSHRVGTLRQLMHEKIVHAGGQGWINLLEWMREQEPDLDRIRAVFFFDN